MEVAQGICNDVPGKLEGLLLLRVFCLHFQNPLVMHRSSLETQNQYLHIIIQIRILEQCPLFLSIPHVTGCLFPQRLLHWQIYSKMTRLYHKGRQGYPLVLQFDAHINAIHWY